VKPEAIFFIKIARKNNEKRVFTAFDLNRRIDEEKGSKRLKKLSFIQFTYKMSVTRRLLY
jgi:hypothetical protein